MNRIKLTFLFLLTLAVAASSSFAQDPDIERLKKITGIIQKVNALPVEFLRASQELTPAGAVNVSKQAALLKQLPAGTGVEIGVHTYAVGDEPKNVILTQQRAEKIKSMLVEAGIRQESLTALGYGSSKPLVSIAADPKNRRVEYLVTKTGTSTSGRIAASDNSAIVAGRGWGKVSLGATREEIDSVLGNPDYSGKDTVDNQSYATYFKKGCVVVFNGQMKASILRFIGDKALYANGDSKFESFPGKPDKGLAWRSSSAQVIAVYGIPSKRDAYVSQADKVEILNLFYPGIHFMFKGDKLNQINIEASPQAAVVPAVQPASTPKKPVDNRSGEELFNAVKANKIEQIRDLIARGVGLNFERDGDTTLSLAIRDRRTQIAKMLLEAGADPEFAESEYGTTPLNMAVQMSDYDTLELLIEKYKVNVNKPSKSNTYPLHVAAVFGQSWGLTKVLLAAGANANVINDKGEAPIDIARAARKMDIVTALEPVTNTAEISKLKAAWVRSPKAQEPAQQAAAVSPPYEPDKVYGPNEDDPDEVEDIASDAKITAKRLGFQLYEEGMVSRQGRNTNSAADGVRQAVFPGTIYQFVIISKDALAVNAIMNGTLLTAPCDSCRTSISTYWASVEKSRVQNGYFMISFQMQLTNVQNNFVTFIPKGNSAGTPVKWLLFAKKGARK